MKNQTNRKFVSFSKSAGCPYLRRWLAVAILVPATFSYAEGFRNPPPGSFNLGRAGGRIAQVDDSSAVQQNPANLVDLTNAQVQLTPTVVYISAEFTSPNGQSANSINPWKVLPNFFASMPLENDKFSVGLGITMPYGLGSEWDTGSSAFSQPGGVLTYTAPYYSKLTTLNFNPSIAAKLGEDVSVGVGLDVMWSELEFKQYLSPACARASWPRILHMCTKRSARNSADNACSPTRNTSWRPSRPTTTSSAITFFAIRCRRARSWASNLH